MSPVVPGLGTPLCPNGDGRQSGSETDVHESCQPLTVINATSSLPSDRGEIEGGRGCGGGGGCGGYTQEPVTQLWPHQLFPLRCLTTTAISVDHIPLIGLRCLANTHSLFYTLNMLITISEMASTTQVL